MYSMKNLVKLVCCLFFLTSFQTVAAKGDTDIEKLRKLFIEQAISPGVNSEKVDVLLSSIQPDGTWPGIDYTDVSRTGFQHSRHLDNLVVLSRAYKKKDSPFKGKRNVKQAFDQALAYWMEHDFICENWWNNEIGTPSAFITMLLVMDESLDKAQVEKMLPIAQRANLNAWGARPSGDRIKIAGLQAKTALFCRDAEQLGEVLKVLEGEIKFSTEKERGIQYDYSFHHREDRVNNTLSYGLGYVDAFAEWAANVADTRFRFSDHAMHLAVDYYLDGVCKQMVYGREADTGIRNRDITRPDRKGYFGIVTPERFLKASDYRKAELENIIKARMDLP